MTGGHYFNQLYHEYEQALATNETLLTAVKRQTALHLQEVERTHQLEKKLAVQKAKMDVLAGEVAVLKKELLRLHGLTQTNGSNSGMPTSQTPVHQTKRIPNSRQLSTKRKGGQPGHKKATLAPFKLEEVTTFDRHELAVCPDCQGVLVETAETRVKDELDYEVIIVKKRHEFPEYRCTQCGHKNHARIPANLKEAAQYGSHVQALALSFMNEANVSIHKTKQMIEGFTFNEISPSEGYLAKRQKRAAKLLGPFMEELRGQLLTQPLLYWDDTVIMIDTKRSCLRFYGDEQFAFYKAHLHKDLEGIKSDQLLTLLGAETTVMHDHNRVNYNPQFSYENIECNVHLLRDLRKCVDNTGHQWAKQLDDLITEANHKRTALIAAGETAATQTAVVTFFAQLDACLVKGRAEVQHDATHYYTQTERALLNRLGKYRPYYFAWVTNFDLPFSNNLSERGLRGVKSKLKVAGQFQTWETASFYATIKSYLETCYRHGVNGIASLERLLSGQPYTVKELLSQKQVKKAE